MGVEGVQHVQHVQHVGEQHIQRVQHVQGVQHVGVVGVQHVQRVQHVHCAGPALSSSGAGSPAFSRPTDTGQGTVYWQGRGDREREEVNSLFLIIIFKTVEIKISV